MSRNPTNGEGTNEGLATWEHELLPGDPFIASKPEAFDALADLFLGADHGGAPRAPGALTVTREAPTLRLVPDSPMSTSQTAPSRDERRFRPQKRAARLEGLILGHLPVLASAWVMQYARHIAGQEPGPIALLRLRSGEGTLELIGAEALSSLGDDRRFDSLRDAAEHLAGRSAAWLIRVEEAAEPMLAELRELDQLTLLSGADEAATVAAYRAIKHLVPVGDDGEGPAIRLAMMGVQPDRAQASSTKLARAAEAFLQRTIEVTACVAKIAGGHRSELAWSGRVEAPIEETLGWIARTVRATPFTPRAAELSRSVERSVSPSAASEPASRLAAAAIEINTTPAVRPAPAPRPAPAHVTIATLPPISSDLPTVRDTAPKPGLLSRHLPSLQALALTCPYASGVELATADDGTLHLLALEGAAADQPALPRLITAAAWVRDHLPILKLAAPAEGRRISDAEPILHLLTTSAPTVRRLTESGVRLHVLVGTKNGEETVWACADLN